MLDQSTSGNLVNKQITILKNCYRSRVWRVSLRWLTLFQNNMSQFQH